MEFHTFLVYFFRFFSFVVGLPGLVGTLYFGHAAFKVLRTPSTPSRPYAATKDPAVDVVQITARVAGAFFKGLGILGSWLIWGLLAISMLALAFGVILWITAQGLAAGREWARVASALCGAVLLCLLIGPISGLIPSRK